MLVKTAGVKHLIILINKMDDFTVNWDEKRLKQINWISLQKQKKKNFNFFL